MRREKKKKPNDYPLISFRLSSLDSKKKLTKLLNEITSTLNQGIKDDEKKIKKYQVFEEALLKGLEFVSGVRKK